MDPKTLQLSREWFAFAENDQKAALKLVGDFNSIVCFHCQQSAEKYIKGLLIFLHIDFRKSHDLNYLLSLLDGNVPDEVFAAAEFLHEYAVETRYPGDYTSITNEETNQAIEYSHLIKQFVLKTASENGFPI